MTVKILSSCFRLIVTFYCVLWAVLKKAVYRLAIKGGIIIYTHKEYNP